MTRVPVLTKFFIALILLAGITGLVGCSHGDSGTTPATTPELTADTTLPDSPSGDGVTLGYFQFVFDDNEVSVEEVSPVRGAEFNVGGKALIILEDFWFDNENRNWHIIATIRNVSIFTGYDVWAVFHSMGNKFVLNTDGFLWAMPPVFPVPTRCPFIAYGKDQPNRAYTPGFQDTREIIIHQPEGIPNLAPIGFWVDATVFPRRTPGVEDLMVEPVNDTTDSTYQLTGFIWDHQSPSKDLVAWADCTHFNGQNYVPLFDDGNHGDGDAGDDIWGATFSGDPDEGPYRLTVYAFDPQYHQGENDAWFLHGGPCNEPLQPIPFETVDKGEHSGIDWEETIVVNDWDTWKQVWQLHTSYIMPPPPIPEIDFTNHTVVGVWVSWRPSNNHHATITAINFDPCEDLVIVDYVYTPYEACGPLDVMTDPFHIVVTPKFEWDAYFVGVEVPCPPPPPECEESMPIHTVIHGVHSGITEPYELRIGNKDDFMALWQQHTSIMIPPPPPPEINWDIHDVAAVGIGNRNTGGFECNIYEFCWLNTGGMGVFYVERIPGPDCNVPQVFTQPHHWILVPKVDSPLFFFKSEEVYSCGPCEPVPWFQLAEGDVSCADPGEYGFQDFNQEFEDLWYKVHCWGPDSGDPPPPLPPIPPPTQDGSMKPFIIQAPHFPTTGFFLTIDDVCIEECTLVVNYTLHIPGESCNVGQFPTQPWVFGVAEFPPIKCLTQWEFIGHEEVYECGECEPIPWYQLAEDEHSCADPGEYGFQGFNQQFEDLWVKLHCGQPPPLPEIPDPINPAWEMKPFVIQAPEFPTTGYYLTIDDVCLAECTAVVEYTLWIPGPGCPVAGIETQPWVFGVAEFPPIDCPILWKFNGHEEVYECGDCNPVPFWQTAQGSHSCADPGEYGWQHQEGYKQFWQDIHCGDFPPMPIDPEPTQGGIIYHAGIQLPHRPSTGYFITFDEVCIEGCDVYIEYTEHIPGPNCNVLWVITKPWAIAAIELPPVYCYWTWHFEKYEEVYNCPDENCWDFETIMSGQFSECEGPLGWLIDSPQEWYGYWMECHPQLPIPPYDLPQGWGAYAVHIGERPTSGYSVEVFEICESDDPFGAAVRWTEWIPGDSCDVLQVITTPWTLVTMPLVDLPYFDEGFEEVYECD